MKIIKIPADASPIEEFNCDEVDLRHILGGWLERVRIGDYRTGEAFGKHHHHPIMLVDEEGRIKGLPINPRASILYGIKSHGEPIAGLALIVGEHFGSEGPEFTDLAKPFDTAQYWNDWFAEEAGEQKNQN